ncbi:MAG: VanZ family protein [Terrimesophilobacter sp.]
MLRRRRILQITTVCYLGVVGWITLGPQPLDGRSAGILRSVLDVLARSDLTRWIGYDLVEFTANIAMFMPVGLSFLLLASRWWLALAAGVALTCTIEFTQLFLPGRVSDARDILANSLGALLGVIIGLMLRRSGATTSGRLEG